MNLGRFFRVGAAILSCAFLAQPALAQPGLSAFRGFIAAGEYDDANFYLANGYVTAADLDTSALFYSLLHEQYIDALTRNGRAIDTLYNYLAAIAPIDLNRRFDCNDGGTCLLVNDLMHGARPAEMAWFVARGLDLNKREADLPAATIPAMIRFGAGYSLADINWMSTNGMVLGDESYPIEELVSYRDGALRSYPYELELPDNYLNLGDQNFLDLLVVLLATDTGANSRSEARRHDTLCSFISYAASAYTPSFDYLEHVLQSVDSFRGSFIGHQVQGDGGVYMPFPTACVSLLQAMAVSHARLNEVMDRFAANGDVETARWLLSLMQARS